MPSERRKEQNRVNQRKYRSQIKNQIQMLEQAIIDVGSAAGRGATIQQQHAEVPTRNSSTAATGERQKQDTTRVSEAETPNDEPEALWDLAPSQFRISSDTSTGSALKLLQDDDLSYLSTGVAPLRLPERTLVASSHATLAGNEPMSQTESGPDKQDVIASLREENKRLMDFSMALVNMYSCSSQPKSHNASTSSQIIPLAPADSFLGLLTPETPVFADDCLDFLNPMHAQPSCDPSSSVMFDPGYESMQFLEQPMNPGYFGFGFFNDTVASQQTNCLITQSPNTAHITPEYVSTAYSTPLDESYTATPYAPLPLPTSYAHLESTFSRCLLRSIYQTGYHVLTHNTHFPPTLISRIFGFCLLHNALPAIREKMRRTLGLGTGGILLMDQLRWGLIPDRRDEETALGEKDGWMEVGDVEWWLRERGFGVDGTGQTGFVRCVKSPQQSQVQTSLKAPMVPYGTVCETADFESWLREPNDAISANTFPTSIPSSDMYQAYAPASQYETLAFESSGQLDASTCYLDMERFFTSLMGSAICLGRAAGFRVVEVQEHLDQCLVRGTPA